MRRLLLSILCIPLLTYAQQDSVQELQQVEVYDKSVKVKANPFQEVISDITLPQNPMLVNTTDNLNLIPGISAFEGTAGTAKFSYRGFGARTQYTTSRSLVYLDEIPISSIQGFSSFEELNPFWFASFGMVKQIGQFQPSALGGVLKYKSRLTGLYDLRELSTQLNVGSYGLLQSNTLFSSNHKNLYLQAGYENTSKKGWRENNSLQRQSFYLNSRWILGTGKSLRWIAHGIKNRVEIPSSISLSEFQENPEKAADSWAEIAGFKEYNRLITGLTFENFAANNFDYNITTFYRFLDNFEPRPFNILEEKRHSGGVRFSLKKDSLHLGRFYSNFTSFGEYQFGSELASTYDNVYDSIRNTHNNKGPGIGNNRLIGHRINGGVGLNTTLGFDKPDDGEYFVLQKRVNVFYQYNQVLDMEEDFEIPFQIAPVISLIFINDKNRFQPELKVYRSFSVPALEENLDPDGHLNSGLKPELAWTGEFGFGWIIWEEKSFNKGLSNFLNLHLNYFFSEVENLIVPRIIGPDQVVATNSGSSRHTGLEFQLAYRKKLMISERDWHPKFILSGYYGRFSYMEFSDTSGSFNGNQLPGFPDWQLNASFEINYDGWRDSKSNDYLNKSKLQFTLGFLGRYSAGYYVNDENTVATDPFFLLQGWLQLERKFGKAFIATATFGAKNLTNTHYASMTVVNNQAFGGAEPRYYYPGEPINWYGGVSLSYTFK